MQFLTEAVLISVGGGAIGILAGVAMPLSVSSSWKTSEFRSRCGRSRSRSVFRSLVGLVFGMLPASRASRLNPTEALRYE